MASQSRLTDWVTLSFASVMPVSLGRPMMDENDSVPLSMAWRKYVTIMTAKTRLSIILRSSILRSGEILTRTSEAYAASSLSTRSECTVGFSKSTEGRSTSATERFCRPSAVDEMSLEAPMSLDAMAEDAEGLRGLGEKKNSDATAGKDEAQVLFEVLAARCTEDIRHGPTTGFI